MSQLRIPEASVRGCPTYRKADHTRVSYLLRPDSLRKAILIFISISSLSYFGTAHGFTWKPNELQFRLFPDYCKAKMAWGHLPSDSIAWKNQDELQYWRKKAPEWNAKFRGTFSHIHHYCAGLAFLTEAENPTTKDRKAAYQRAAGEIGYTRTRSGQSSPLWTEMTIMQARAWAGLARELLREGEAETAKETYALALQTLGKLQEQEPNRAEIYIELAKILEGAEKHADAIDALEKGMTITSNDGPFLFYLAYNYYDLGDIERATDYATRAEAAGMKMDQLRRLLAKGSTRAD